MRLILRVLVALAFQLFSPMIACLFCLGTHIIFCVQNLLIKLNADRVVARQQLLLQNITVPALDLNTPSSEL